MATTSRRRPSPPEAQSSKRDIDEGRCRRQPPAAPRLKRHTKLRPRGPRHAPGQRLRAPLAATIHVDDRARQILHVRRSEHGGERRNLLGALDAPERQLVGTERLLPAILVAKARFGALA